MNEPLDRHALDQLFYTARTFKRWHDREVSDELLHRLIDLVRMGPTSANCSPARIVFVKTPAEKARLIPCLNEGNREQTRTAPVTAIIGSDLQFYEHLPRLYPYTDARSWYAGKPKAIEAAAVKNSSLQGAYLILAARALGLDCGPMGGFDSAAVDEAFFAGTQVKANFLCNLGFGDRSALHSRSPRFTFDEMARIV
jgi:3-hydroxypropanoate dehydrogenase